MNLKTTTGVKSNPLDEMLLSHRVLNLTDGDLDNMTVTLDVDDGNMLLNGSIDRVCGNNLIALGSLNLISGNEELTGLSILQKRCHIEINPLN